MELIVMLCHLSIILISAACFVVPVPIPLNILVHSVALIIIGSVYSVKFLIREKISKTDFSHDESVIEAVGMSEAYKFPIVGGGILLSLYILVKFFGKNSVNLFLIGYFMLIGMESFKGILNNYTRLGKVKEKSDIANIKTPILFKDVNILGVDLSISIFDLI